MTPTPDTTARTETAETDNHFIAEMRDRADALDRKYGAANAPEVGMLRRSADALSGDVLDMAAIGRSFMTSLETVTSIDGPYKDWTPAEDPAELVLDLYNDLEEARAALSPQHPVGVREALEKSLTAIASAEEALIERQLWTCRVFAKERTREEIELAGEWCAPIPELRITKDIIATALSHPPAQDAPGAVKEWPKGCTGYMPDYQAGGDCVNCGRVREDHAEFADPSPPLPEADGEVVALADRIDNAVQAMSETHHSWEARCHAIMAALGFNFGWDDAEQDAAPISAQRERYREERDAERAAKLEERAAREKAEQVAAGLRERILSPDFIKEVAQEYLSHRGERPWRILRGGQELWEAHTDAIKSGLVSALRASTEEGKTATPSVKDEEVGRG